VRLAEEGQKGEKFGADCLFVLKTVQCGAKMVQCGGGVKT
jgi:hypothetical protein